MPTKKVFTLDLEQKAFFLNAFESGNPIVSKDGIIVGDLTQFCANHKFEIKLSKTRGSKFHNSFVPAVNDLAKEYAAGGYDSWKTGNDGDVFVVPALPEKAPTNTKTKSHRSTPTTNEVESATKAPTASAKQAPPSSTKKASVNKPAVNDTALFLSPKQELVFVKGIEEGKVELTPTGRQLLLQSNGKSLKAFIQSKQKVFGTTPLDNWEKFIPFAKDLLKRYKEGEFKDRLAHFAENDSYIEDDSLFEDTSDTTKSAVDDHDDLKTTAKQTNKDTEPKASDEDDIDPDDTKIAAKKTTTKSANVANSKADSGERFWGSAEFRTLVDIYKTEDVDHELLMDTKNRRESPPYCATFQYRKKPDNTLLFGRAAERSPGQFNETLRENAPAAKRTAEREKQRELQQLTVASTAAASTAIKSSNKVCVETKSSHKKAVRFAAMESDAPSVGDDDDAPGIPTTKKASVADDGGRSTDQPKDVKKKEDDVEPSLDTDDDDEEDDDDNMDMDGEMVTPAKKPELKNAPPPVTEIEFEDADTFYTAEELSSPLERHAVVQHEGEDGTPSSQQTQSTTSTEQRTMIRHNTQRHFSDFCEGKAAASQQVANDFNASITSVKEVAQNFYRHESLWGPAMIESKKAQLNLQEKLALDRLKRTPKKSRKSVVSGHAAELSLEKEVDNTSDEEEKDRKLTVEEKADMEAANAEGENKEDIPKTPRGKRRGKRDKAQK